VKSLDAFDWTHVETDLDMQGHATLRGLLTEPECKAVASQADTMLRRFRSGLPPELAALRASLYGRLVATARRWQDGLGEKWRHPDAVNGHPTERSALSRLRAGEHWGLHKDIEGEHPFPLQVSALLSRPNRDFSGGELVMTELRPRMQSRPIVVVPEQGDAIIFAADGRPFRGKTGSYRVSMKHAVSRVRSGERVALELLF
jgi:hypothetical protein